MNLKIRGILIVGEKIIIKIINYPDLIPLSYEDGTIFLKNEMIEIFKNENDNEFIYGLMIQNCITEAEGCHVKELILNDIYRAKIAYNRMMGRTGRVFNFICLD